MEWFKKAHGEASLALRHNFLQRRAGIVAYDRIESARTRYELPEQDIEKLYNMIGTERDKEMAAILYGMFREELLTEAGFHYVETVSAMLNERIFDRVFRLYGKESVDILRLFKQVSSIEGFDHLHEYLRSVEELLTRLHQYVKSLKSVSVDNRTMKEALQYIHDHYDKDINMTMVSNSISLNYYYFSQSFKEYTGDNFIDYLRKLRISKAKELLAATDLKVYEIAGRSGFANIKHFNRVFRKLEGISPLEYREQQHIQASRKG
jgi:two-component system response regulator YesN